MSSAPIRQPPLRLVIYALPSLVSSVAALPLVLFVPAFYADDLGVSLAAVGPCASPSGGYSRRIIPALTLPDREGRGIV